MSTVSLRKTNAEALHDIIRKWVAKHPDEPIDHEEIAVEAINARDWQPQRRNLVKELAKQLARVTGAKHETNEQGVRVKKYHAVNMEVVINGKKTQKTLWRGRKKMSADHAHISFRQEWERIAGHCKSLNFSQTDFNWNNPNAKNNPSQLGFDFTMVVDVPEVQKVEKIEAESPPSKERARKPKPR